MRNPILSILVLIVCLQLSACNRSTAPSSANKPSQTPDTSQSEPNATDSPSRDDAEPNDGVIELRSVAARSDDGLLADEIKLSDQKGGWRTEAFHESIKPRLKSLGEIIQSGNWTDLEHELVAKRFVCSDLRPDERELSTVFQDTNLIVLRPSSRQPFAAKHEGTIGFERSLRRLISPFKPNSLVVNFKVYKVAVQEEVAESVMHVDTDGFRESGGVEQNMVWKCEWRRLAQDEWKMSSVELTSFEEVRYRRSAEAKLFSDCTESLLAGNDCFRDHLQRSIDHWRFRIEERYGIDSVSLTGLAVGDVNNDGLDDVYFCDVGGLPNRLFVQQPDGTAVDVSAKSGVDWLDRSRGALFVDLDNDGDQDLIVSLGSSSLLLMANDGTGKFAVQSRLRPHPTTQSISAVDYDNDGQLDIYVCGYGNSLETFADSKTPMPWHDANNGASNTMFHNDGNWKFTDVTAKIGLDENNRRYSYAASWDDFDNDGDQDLYVANDFGRNNLYVNEGGRFRDAAKEAGAEDKSLGMSVDWGDIDNDGRMDLYVGNMFSGAGNRITFQDQFMTGASAEVIEDFRYSARGNTLFRQNGKSVFDDISLSAGVTMGRWSWSSLFADINNDGWQDLIVTNGHVSGVEPDDL